MDNFGHEDQEHVFQVPRVRRDQACTRGVTVTEPERACACACARGVYRANDGNGNVPLERPWWSDSRLRSHDHPFIVKLHGRGDMSHYSHSLLLFYSQSHDLFEAIFPAYTVR